MAIKLPIELRDKLRKLDFDQLLDVQLYISRLLRKRFRQSGTHNDKRQSHTTLLRGYSGVSPCEDTEPEEVTRIIPELSYEIGGRQYQVGSDTEEFIPTQYNVEFDDAPVESTPNVDLVTGDSLWDNNHIRAAASIKSNLADEENDGGCGTKLEEAAVIHKRDGTPRSRVSIFKDTPRNQLNTHLVKVESVKKRNSSVRGSEDTYGEYNSRWKRADIRSEVRDVTGDSSFVGKLNVTPQENKQTNEHKSKLKKVNFNFNPLTKKSWILEDFKPNRDINAVRRGQKKLEAFYSKTGNPRHSMRDGVLHNDYTRNKNSDDTLEFTFDNLRVRSHSPPGFGRLDFPSTQEHCDDKREAQRIIHEKTKYRFMRAVNSQVPPQEREFLFKREELNNIVDDNEFTWSEKELMVYPGIKKAS